ncbi:histidine kinase [Maribacter algicola]|uniref:Histidine kinase n=1 Tax=Maribacter algicola TaxID=2498892 RepID=A0A3R8S0K8_9FLAO|nr:histidine kinase [Maribacter algicola]RRQ49336.1 histidine kinase [Maribacter algicola]
MASFIKKHRWAISFWLVQLLSWGGLVFIAYAFTPDADGYKATNLFKYGLLSTFLIGVFSTSLLRFYLKRILNFDAFETSQILKILIGISVVSLIYFGLSYGTGYYMGKCGEEDVKVPEMYKEFGLGLMLINSFITIFGWTIFYLSVKIAAKLNANRVERAELNASLRQAQLNTLKGQINPHFMFNSLNNIRGLMLEDVEKSRDMLTKLSEMLRYSLTKNNINSIKLVEELEMVDNYIALSKIQFEDRLQFLKEVQSETLEIKIPPMIIQLLVENATKHGISKLKAGGTIKLVTGIENQDLIIKVLNTGTLQIAEDSTQLGLKNIKQRLRLLYGDQANFSIEEINGEVVATINIPLT